MRASYRYALVALVATALAVGIGAWLGTRPPPPPAPVPATAAAPDEAQAAPPVDRAAVLDRIEASEREAFGEEEAARRRRQRERMLDARLGERRE